MINVSHLSKVYKLYNKPADRLKEAIFPFAKKYAHHFYALKDVSFAVSSGETIGIIGRNGSGKSTLLKILTGVLSSTSGQAEINGKVSALLELGAGFNPEYTGIENIYLSGAIMGYTREQMDGRLDDILSFAEIGEFVKQPVKTYSSGMFVRLAFAVAINVEPEILIVDEALAVGDYRFQARCYKKFDELKSKGKTILFVTHDVDAVRHFCTRAIWLNEGEIIADGEVGIVTSQYMEYITSSDALASVSTTVSGDNDVESTPLQSTPATSEFNPVNRFGSDMGAVLAARLSHIEKASRKEVRSTSDLSMVCSLNDKIRMDITVNIPENADLNSVSFAIAVKNKAGLDIFVTSTHDAGVYFTKHGINNVTITFDNYLNAGEYSLVAALENRATIPITYYDYIEGAAYIKSVSDKEYYGVMVIPSHCEIS